MVFRGRGLPLLAVLACILVSLSCAKKEKEAGKEAAGSASAESTLSYVSDEVSFGAFFNSEGTERTIKARGAGQIKLYIVVNFPETMQIAAVEWRLVLPEGCTVENDKFYEKRVALLGTFEHGISETFPCAPGPRIVLHELTLNVPADLKNGEIAIMPSLEGKILAVAQCDEARSLTMASAYKAMINPED